MKSNILTIMKKELSRFFGDKRMVITTVLLPGFMIYAIYSFMGSGPMKNFVPDENYQAKVLTVNMPEDFKGTLEEKLPALWETAPDDMELEEVRSRIQEKELDGLVVFPENFTEKVNAYDVKTGSPAPNVEIYYNSANTESEAFYDEFTKLLDTYETSMSNKLDINAGEADYDCASDRDVTGQIFSMLLPMLLMTFLYSGCVAVAPESIAGEKERGTIATLLVTPLRRRDLALGKILSLSIISLLSGASSFIGTILSLPKMMQGEVMGIDSSVYQPMDYLLLSGIVFSTVLVLVSLISVVSAMARNMKEAGTAISPLVLVIMFISLIPMLGGDMPKALSTFVIPLYNSVQCMQGIFAFSYEPLQVAITFVSNLIWAGVLAFILTKLFNSEKIMFAK